MTETARQVVTLAQEESRILKHDYIDTEHILLGLLREREGLGARVLESLDVTLERVRAQVVRIVEPVEHLASGYIPFTPRAQKVRELALREALSLGHEYIGTEHILLWLVREDGGVAASILRECGADEEDVRKEVIRMLPGSDERPPSRGQGEKTRIARARLKRELKSGSLDVAELIRDPPPEVLTAKVADLLVVARGSGRVRMHRALTHARISPSKSVGGLSDRQRQALVDWLRRSPPYTSREL